MVSGGELKHVVKRLQKGKYLRFGLLQYLFTLKWQRHWIPELEREDASPLSLQTPKGVVKNARFIPAMVASSRGRINDPVPQAVVTTAADAPLAVTQQSHLSLWKPKRTTQWLTPRFEPGGHPISLRSFHHES